MEDVAEQGEESGREEAADQWPFLPLISLMSKREYRTWRRGLTRRGRGRAQGLYELYGRQARIFANNWAMGYASTCRIFEEDGYLINAETVEYALCAILSNRVRELCR